jgi:hypothetical protein
MRYATLLCLVCAGIAVGSLRLLSQGRGTIYGAGTNTCVSWTESRTNQSWYTAGQWVLGFVSAVNHYAPAAPVKTDARAMADWIDKYCLQHPDDDVADAAAELVDFLLAKP